MTAKQLINKLKKLPEDAEIEIYNNDGYVDGFYKATGIKYYKNENFIEIESNYMERIEQ